MSIYLNPDTIKKLVDENDDLEQLLDKIKDNLIEDVEKLVKQNKLDRKNWNPQNFKKVANLFWEEKKKNPKMNDKLVWKKVFLDKAKYPRKKLARFLFTTKKMYEDLDNFFIAPMNYISCMGGYCKYHKEKGGKKKIDPNPKEKTIIEFEDHEDDSDATDLDIDSEDDEDCDCHDYCLQKSDVRPTCIDENDNIWSVLEPEHLKSDHGVKQIMGDLQPIPNYQRERECILISGPSGCGKSTFAKMYARNYKQLFPGNRVLLIAQKDFTPPTGFPYEKASMDPDKLKQYTIDKWNRSLLIFDDVENLSSNKEVQDYYVKFLEEALNVGRSKKITILMLSHILLNYRFSRNMIMESNKIVIFPKCGLKYQYNKFLKLYCGLDKNAANNLLKQKTRWICIDKEAPLNIVSENQCSILS